MKKLSIATVALSVALTLGNAAHAQDMPAPPDEATEFSGTAAGDAAGNAAGMTTGSTAGSTADAAGDTTVPGIADTTAPTDNEDGEAGHAAEAAADTADPNGDTGMFAQMRNWFTGAGTNLNNAGTNAGGTMQNWFTGARDTMWGMMTAAGNTFTNMFGGGNDNNTGGNNNTLTGTADTTNQNLRTITGTYQVNTNNGMTNNNIDAGAAQRRNNMTTVNSDSRWGATDRGTATYGTYGTTAGGTNNARDMNDTFNMTTYRTTAANDDEMDWGWLGLLGLIGLAGLRSRNGERNRY